MVAYINGERYENNGGRLTVCCSPMGLFGSARWRLYCITITGNFYSIIKTFQYENLASSPRTFR